MGKFLNQEKLLQTKFKQSSQYFSKPARADGVYKRIARPFCLPKSYANENLYPEIRQEAIDYFRDYGIKWHDGQDGSPSNHLCDSQVCCVNFLFAFTHQPAALAELLTPIYPDLHRMLPVENNQFVAFEWIGQENYLGERMPKNGKRTRGANFTSADVAVYFKRKDGRKQFVLIEWKYTESYSSTPMHKAKSGTDRTLIYLHLYDQDNCPIDKPRLPGFGSLFYEPFYQFMRQQFLAHEMEKAHELGADIVSVLHIAPAHNLDFKRVTSPELKSLGDSATGVWSSLVKPRDRFTSVSAESLFGGFNPSTHNDLGAWWDYLTQRYSYVYSYLPT